MKADELSINIIALDNKIRFAGVIDRSGRMYAGMVRKGTQGYLNEKNAELSLAQTAYIVDLRQIFKLFSIPIKEHILVFSADNPVSVEDLVDEVTGYLKLVEADLVFYPPHDIINSEKRQILRNLYESGISEEIIAEHLGLDIGTVKILIQEIKV